MRTNEYISNQDNTLKNTVADIRNSAIAGIISGALFGLGILYSILINETGSYNPIEQIRYLKSHQVEINFRPQEPDSLYKTIQEPSQSGELEESIK